ncbi:MAG: recombinase family protein [Promethearchaeia archaeon]
MSKKIRSIRTPGGHRRCPVQEINRILEGREKNRASVKDVSRAPLKCVLHGRVSSHKQSKRGDLARQVKHLKEHAHHYGFEIYRVYKDVGSGLNAKRKGLWRLIKDAKEGRTRIGLRDLGIHILHSICPNLVLKSPT